MAPVTIGVKKLKSYEKNSENFKLSIVWFVLFFLQNISVYYY